MAAHIPERSTSKYNQQYVGSVDAQRIIEIFGDSNRIALTSKTPATAADRFALAVEAYHQLMSMNLHGDNRSAVQDTMQSLVESFPVQVVANEALGLREKARKLKTPRKQLELLQRARDILDRGIAANPGSTALETAMDELCREVAESEARLT